MDLKITDYCNAGCAWCHEGSTVHGVHGDLRAVMDLLAPLQAGTEVAIGGGDPLSHPDFEWFVRGLKGRGLVPSVTVNGKHLEQHLPVLKELTGQGSLYGVGVSYHDRLPTWEYKHLVLHLISGIHSPSVLEEATQRMKVLVLGYKKHGRGRDLFEIRPEPVQRKLAQWYRQLFLVGRSHHLSFDALAIEQLKPERLFADRSAYQRHYMGPEGAHGMYLDAVTQTFAVSSYSATREPWSDLRSMFGWVRRSSGMPAMCESPPHKFG
jgi:hypothetical protein